MTPGPAQKNTNLLKYICLSFLCGAASVLFPAPAAAGPEVRPAGARTGRTARKFKSRFFRVKVLAPGVWGLQSLSTKGAYCNGGFIVTENGVIMVDAYARSQAARDAVRIVKSVTSKPITHLVFTHHHFDHVGGSRVFSRKTRIVAHENVTPRLKRYNPTGARMPDVTYRDGLELCGGANRVLLLHMGRGHTNADTFVLVPRHGVLFGGDMIVHKDAGFFGQAYVLEWIWTLKLLSVLPIRTVVPGHGAIGGRSVLTDMIRYLSHLYDTVRHLKARGLSDRAVLRRFKPGPPYSGWAFIKSRWSDKSRAHQERVTAAEGR